MPYGMPNTGEICQQTGYYRFVRYQYKTTKSLPTNEEREIPLEKGEKFPPIRSTSEAAYWAFDHN